MAYNTLIPPEHHKIFSRMKGDHGAIFVKDFSLRYTKDGYWVYESSLVKSQLGPAAYSNMSAANTLI